MHHSCVFLTDEFQEVCWIVVAGTDHNLGYCREEPCGCTITLLTS